MNFVFVSLQPINTDRDSTSTCLAKELAKKHRVLYVNPPIDRRTLLSKKKDSFTQAHIGNIRNRGKKLVQLKNGLWMLRPARILESINWIPSSFIFKKLNRINNVRFAKDIREALTELRFENFILINDKDIFRSFYLKELLHPDKYIYLDRDYTIGMDYWKRHGVEMEMELIKKSDAVVCNSYDFTNRAKRYNSNSFYIGNGFEMEQYSVAEEVQIPVDLEKIPAPRIGYIGALITMRLDLELMVAMAKAKPHWNFVLIGGEDARFERSELHRLKNVHFLGKKHTKDVPAYLKYFDVCINPQIVNDITIGNFPLKVVEYLAMGKPAVVTATNPMRDVFSNHTYLAMGREDFVRKIEKALQEDNPCMQKERKTFAASFSWDNVTKNLMEHIQKTPEKVM